MPHDHSDNNLGGLEDSFSIPPAVLARIGEQWSMTLSSNAATNLENAARALIKHRRTPPPPIDLSDLRREAKDAKKRHQAIARTARTLFNQLAEEEWHIFGLGLWNLSLSGKTRLANPLLRTASICTELAPHLTYVVSVASSPLPLEEHLPARSQGCPPADDGWTDFILAAFDVWVTETGTKPTANWNEYEGRHWSPFIKGLTSLYDALPDDVRMPKATFLGSRTRDLIRVIDWNSTLRPAAS
jgi:hypothetical protein